MAFITDLTTPGGVTGVFVGGLPSGVDNDQGNIRGGGTIAETGSFSSSSFGEGNPIITIVSGVGPVEGIGYGNFNSGLQVINAAQTTIAGVANTALQGGQSDSANVSYTPLQLAVLRTYYYKTSVQAGNWNIFTGAFSSINILTSGVYDIAGAEDTSATIRSSGTDYAANPSQNEPGLITFRDGSPNPINSGYGPRYLW